MSTSAPRGSKVAIDEASYQVDRDRMLRAIRLLQMIAGVLSLLVAGMVVALYQISAQAERSVSEVNKIRAGIQDVFQQNLPLIAQINEGLSNAVPQAEQLNKALKSGGELDQRINDAMDRAEQRVPAAIEDYLRNNMARLLSEAQSRAAQIKRP